MKCQECKEPAGYCRELCVKCEMMGPGALMKFGMARGIKRGELMPDGSKWWIHSKQGLGLSWECLRGPT